MTSQNKPYDLVITGGRVIDPETGLDEVRNVGIKGDKTNSPILRLVRKIALKMTTGTSQSIC